MEFREFTKTDWYGYAGAEEPTNGIEKFPPLIAYAHDATLLDFGWTVIVDATGIQAELLSPEGEPHAILFYDMVWPECLKVARALSRSVQFLDYGTLRVLGFKYDE